MMTKAQAKDVAALSYAEASAELDDIVSFFDGAEVDIDELVAKLERATALVDELDRRLKATKIQVEELAPRLTAVADEDDVTIDPDTGEVL